MRLLFLAACAAVAATIAATVVFTVAAFAAHETSHQCSIASDSDFYATVAHRNPKIMMASDKARDTIIAAVNVDRKAKGMFLIEADTLVIGLFSESGMMYVGLVAFKDRCVVPGTVAVMEARQWVGYMLSVGLNADDFVEVRNG